MGVFCGKSAFTWVTGLEAWKLLALDVPEFSLRYHENRGSVFLSPFSSHHVTAKLVRLHSLFIPFCQPLIGQRGVFHAKLFHSLFLFSAFFFLLRLSIAQVCRSLFLFSRSAFAIYIPVYAPLCAAPPPWFPAITLSLIHMPPPLVQNLSH